MATLTQIPPTNPTNRMPPSESTPSPTEKSSSPAPTNQIVPSAQPCKLRKFVMHPDDSDDSDQDLELDDDPLAQLELTGLKSILKEEVKFKPADPSTLKNPEEDMMRELEKKGRLIKLGYEESGPTDPLPPSQPKPPPKPLTPLYNPSNLIMAWKQPRRIGSGLYNLGNTCFLNSVVQCLTYTPPLANYFFSREHSNFCKVNGFCAICVLQKHYFQCQNQTSFYPVRPTIVNYLNKIAPCFHQGRQEDAHEFLRYLVDAMQNSCLANSPPKLSQELKCTTVVHQIFGGQVMSQVTCLNCKTKSDTFEPILDLSLHIKGCGTIQEAMRRATMPDRLEGSNSYFCDKCKKKCPAQKLVSIFTPPRVLTIHLKRFSFGSQLGVKLQGKIKFTPLLDIRPYMEDKQADRVEYKLYAVLVHSGFTCNSGHYYCYVVGPNGSWHKMNDSYVTPVGEQFVMDSEAYMLFYRQIVKSPQQKPQTKLVIEGFGANQPSPLSSKQTPLNKSPITPNCKQTNISNQPTSLQSKDASTVFARLSKQNQSEISQKLFKRNENSFETPKKAKENLPNPVTPFSVSSNNSSTSEESTPRTERNKDINSNKKDINNTPSISRTDSINSIDSDKENSHDSINSFKAGTSKPVAVVTPKQTDTKKTTSHISSTAVHRDNAFKTPTHSAKSFYKNTNFVIKKKVFVSPGLDTVAVEDRVKQAQKKHRILQQSNFQDEMEEVAVPSKKPKLETATSSTPAVNKVVPILSQLNKEKENVPSKNTETVSDVKIKPKSDPQDEKPQAQVTKAFSITGVQGVKPTAVVPPANVEVRNTESADREVGQIEVDQSNLSEVDQSNEEIQEMEISNKVTKSEKGNRKERHKVKYLKNILNSHSRSDFEKLSNKAIKREYFKSMEDLESELLEFKKTFKVKVEKKMKKSRDKHKNNNSDETLSSPDQSRHSNKKSHKSDLSSPVLSHRHTHRSNGHSDTATHKDRPHKSGRSASRTKQEENGRDGSGGVKLSKSHSFQSLGGDLKSWEGETSAIDWLECDRLNKSSHSELDPDLDRGKLPKKKKQKTRHGKPTNQKFQAAYDRTH